MSDETNETNGLAPKPVPVPRPGFPIALSPQSKAGIKAILSDPSVLQPEVSPEADPTGSEKFGTPLDEEGSVDKTPAKEIDRGPTGDGVRYSMEPWDTPEARKDVESRCGKLDTSEMATTGRITQIIPVIPGALEVKLCTQCSAESILVQRRSKAESYADYYTAKIEDLAMMLRSGRGFLITGKSDDSELSFPDPLKFNGTTFTWDEKVFESNLNRVQYGIPQPVIARLLVNLWWFESRVRTAMLPENLGNFCGPT